MSGDAGNDCADGKVPRVALTQAPRRAEIPIAL